MNLNCREKSIVAGEVIPQVPGSHLCSISYEGIERTFYVYIPESYDGNNPIPLLIGIHGGGGVAKNFNKLTGFSDLAQKEGFIAVYPQGLYKQWNAGRDDPQLKSKADDVGFISAMVDKIGDRLNIDKKKVYAAGISNGGFLAYKLACELPHKITAVAAVASNLPDLICESDKSKDIPISVLVMNGTDDPLVKWDGGPSELFGIEVDVMDLFSTDDTVDFWVKYNKCFEGPEVKIIPDTDPEDGTTVEEIIYGGGEGGTEVVLYKIKGGGHTWPGGWQYLGEAIIGKTCRDIDGSKVIWDFFKRQDRMEH